MLCQTILLTVLAYFAAKVHCDCTFIQPVAAANKSDTDNDPIYGLGDQLEVKWDWDMDVGDLIVFQDYPVLKTGNNLFKQLDMGTTSTSYTWTIDLSFLIARPGSGETPQFHFELLVQGKGDVVCSSHTFAIFVPDDPKAKESIDTSVHYVGSTATGTTSGGKPTATTNTSDKETQKPTQTSDGHDKGDNGSSSSDKGLIALGAVLGVVVVGAAGAAAYFFLRRRRLQKSGAAGANVVGGGTPYESVPGPREVDGEIMMDPYGRIKSELPGSEVQKMQYQGPMMTEHYGPH